MRENLIKYFSPNFIKNIFLTFIIILLFNNQMLSNLTFELLNYETFPIFLFLAFFISEKQIKKITIFLSIIFFLSFFYEEFFEKNLIINAFIILNYFIVYYFVYNNGNKILFLKILKFIFTFYILLTFLQSNFLFEDIFSVFIRRFTYYLDNFRGISLSFVEPSRASVNLFFLSCCIFFLTKEKKFIFVALIVEILYLRSLTGLFLWSLFLFFSLNNKYKILLILIFLNLILFNYFFSVFDYSVNSRIFQLLSAILNLDFSKISMLSGWRFYISFFSFLNLTNNFFGFGLNGSFSNLLDIMNNFSNHYTYIHIDQLSSIIEKSNQFIIAPIIPLLISSYGIIGVIFTIYILKIYFFKHNWKLDIKFISIIPLIIFLDLGSYEPFIFIALYNLSFKKS